MSNKISSFHIQKANPSLAFLHNSRKVKPDYLIDTDDRNECNCSAEKALQKYAFFLDEALTNYTKRTKQRVQTKDEKFVWEAVLNIKEEHTLNHILRLASILQKIYGWRTIQVALHKDEGYIDENSGEKIYNYHAHIIFFMLSKSGIYMFKKRDFPKKEMSEIQTLVANTLKMNRGKKSNKVRLSAAQYRQVAKEKSELEFRVRRLEDDFDFMLNAAAHLQEENRLLIKERKQMKEKIIELENALNIDDGNIQSLLIENSQYTETPHPKI